MINTLDSLSLTPEERQAIVKIRKSADERLLSHAEEFMRNATPEEIEKSREALRKFREA